MLTADAALPDWWTDGASVVSRDGTKGKLSRTQDGTWLVNLTASNGYIVQPSPRDWTQEFRPEITRMQVRRMVYEADKALLQCFGRGGLLDWSSVPEARRVGPEQPYAMPLADDGLGPLRERLAYAIGLVFAEYLDG